MELGSHPSSKRSMQIEKCFILILPKQKEAPFCRIEQNSITKPNKENLSMWNSNLFLMSLCQGIRMIPLSCPIASSKKEKLAEDVRNP
jgi:hypothetical protein